MTKVVISAYWDKVRRYRAWFSPNPKNSDWPRISNKERFNEQGILESSRIMIPDKIYHAMAKKACAIIQNSTPL